MIATVLFVLFAVAAGLQIAYLLAIFSRLALYREPPPGVDFPFVSVVICARDEAPNLRKNLPLILRQDYPDYEVIVVNDDSEDDSATVLAELAIAHPRLQVSHLLGEKPHPGKKFPLTMGIKAAKGELLLLTDADCFPASDSWLRHMVSSYGPDTEIVLGYGAYERRDGMLNRFIRYETFSTFLQYASFALAGLPYMGVGRNLSYRRDLFFSQRGFAWHQHVLSGDDDLFINRAATSRNTRICIKPEAFTYSPPPETWKAWFRQKKRHLSTGRHYSVKSKLMLAGWNGSQILFYLALIGTLVLQVNLLWVAGLFGVRLLLQQWVFFKVLKRLDAKDLWHISTGIDIVQVCYYFIFAPIAFSGKTSRWR